MRAVQRVEVLDGRKYDGGGWLGSAVVLRPLALLSLVDLVEMGRWCWEQGTGEVLVGILGERYCCPSWYVRDFWCWQGGLDDDMANLRKSV